MVIQDLSGRNAARARRDAQIYGKAALPAKAGANTAAKTKPPVAATPKPAAAAVARSIVTAANSGRDASRLRRQAMSTKGKAGAASNDRQRKMDLRKNEQNQDKDCGCGCKGTGDCNETQASQAAAPAMSLAPRASSTPRRNEIKVVAPSSIGRINSQLRRQALAAHGKTGVDVFRKGASSAQMVRQQNPDISGRELARSVRSQRSNNGGAQSSGRSAPVGRRRPERAANDVSGTKVSHSDKTTGDETGLCRTVTGTDYFSSDVFTEFCQTQAPIVPAKVQSSETLQGGTITSGGKVGRSDNVTGDERGSCRDITGSEYVGREQYDDFCASKPEPGTAKVSFSQTTYGQIISGSKPARSNQVSGNEAGSCKVVTGTPYTGAEHYQKYCETDIVQLAQARNQRRSGNAGRDITGMQPGFAGLTGAGKGACRDVSGTAYVGAEQYQEVCGALPAQIGEPDFPQPLAGAPWGDFSVVAPSHANQTQNENTQDNVTGTRYEQGRISGTFSRGEGKVTGTEQFRFGDSKGNGRSPTRRAKTDRVNTASASAVALDADKVSRVTGEGLDAGLKITGNDWNRGEHVTGTEGTSAMKRNPTRRGPISAMPSSAPKRNEEVERNDINVTGGSGNTDKGAPITLSGGARG